MYFISFFRNSTEETVKIAKNAQKKPHKWETPEKPGKMDNAPKKSQQSDREAIDELFRQATELFDQ